MKCAELNTAPSTAVLMVYWSTDPGRDVKFFLGLSWGQLTVEVMWPITSASG